MAILHEDDFESNDFSNWTETSNSPSIVTSPVYEGTYAVQMRVTAQYTTRSIRQELDAPTTLYFRAYVQWTDVWEQSLYNIEFQQTGGGISYIQGEGDGYPRFITNNVLRGYLSQLSLATWYRIEIRLTFAGASSVCEVKTDGTVELTDTTSITDSVNWYRMTGGAWNTQPQGFNVDAVVIDDAAYPGPLGPADDYFQIYHHGKPNVLLRR